MVVAASNVLDEAASYHFGRPLAPRDFVVRDSQLPEQIFTPGEDLAVRSQEPSKHRSAHNFDDWQLKVNHVGQGSNLLELIQILLEQLIYLRLGRLLNS